MATQAVAITGNTFPVKESLKALGARWNGDAKAWMVSADKADEARKIVASGGTAASSTRAYRPTHCRECGQTASRYNKIYRNGLCSECYRDASEERGMGY